VQVWRKGTVKELTLTVGEAPSEKVAKRSGKTESAASRLGLSLSDLTEAQKKELQVSHGVLVEDAQAQAARAGIRRGDVITSVLNKDVKNVEQFNQILAGFGSGQTVALLVRRGDGALFVPIRIR
jgi:serine protease Do